MIACLIQGGLGNQLFQYAMGRAVAEKRRGDLLLDPRVFRVNTFRRYQLPLFNLKARNVSGLPEARIRLALSDRAKPILPLAYAVAPWLSVNLVRDRELGYDAGVFDQPDRTLFIGFWQAERYFSDIRHQLLGELSFTEPPNTQNLEVLSTIDGSNSVCLHVRRTDFIGNPHLAQLSDDGMAYYRRAIARINETVKDPSFFVFSDDPQWTRANINAGPQTRFITHNVGTQDHEDLRLMMRCKHFIIANSTFSWWGAWLATNPGKLVIAPKVWNIANPALSTDIIPSVWTRL